MQSFKSLSEREILALAISLEEEDARIYADFAEGLRADFPAAAQQFAEMRQEEDGHRHRLLELYRQKFGEHIPLIRRQDVKGFVPRRPVWLVRPLGLNAVRKQAETMELETRRFYETAAQRATDAGIRQLLGDLAEEERKHSHMAEAMARAPEPHEEAAARNRLFVLQVIQPGLAGLMDGSVSTLAPLFAAAFATQQQPGHLPGRPGGEPGGRHQHGLRRGAVRRRQPDRPRPAPDPRRRLRPDDRPGRPRPQPALPHPAGRAPRLQDRHQRSRSRVVLIELVVIAWIRHRYMDTPWRSALFQVVVGGLLVFLTGILIGVS